MRKCSLELQIQRDGKHSAEVIIQSALEAALYWQAAWFPVEHIVYANCYIS